MSFWFPVADKSTSIGSFSKWDQAFRVFLDIYNGSYPERTSELIQYQHIIQTAAKSYAWENVYLYDCEFRRYMERHPSRSWGIILQQAWTMFLKDRVSYTPSKSEGSGSSNQPEFKGHPKKLCFDFDAGNCTFGAKCKFDHHCSYCNKYGHGSFNCRRAAQKGKREGKKPGDSVGSSRSVTV